MTTELEKQFFDTFGIEPEEEHFCLWECKEPSLEHVPCQKVCKHQRHNFIYPAITDKEYIELYCILCDVFNLFDVHRYPVITFRVKDFKENVLKELIWANKYYKQEYIKNQIQKIFI